LLETGKRNTRFLWVILYSTHNRTRAAPVSRNMTREDAALTADINAFFQEGMSLLH